jgi:hypothetical protein
LVLAQIDRTTIADRAAGQHVQRTKMEGIDVLGVDRQSSVDAVRWALGVKLRE